MPILVHDYLLVNRGAERAFCAIAELYPGAPIATLLYDASVFRETLAGHQVSTSPLQRLRLRQTNFKTLLPVLPLAASRLPVTGHDVVISSSSAFAHGVRPDEDARHICYCYTPFRYAWYEQGRGAAQVSPVLRPLLRATLAAFRKWDYKAAQRETHYVAISEISRERIRRYWNRDAEIIYPPVDVERFTIGEPDDSFLFVGELVRHKQAEIALQAAEEIGAGIRIVGDGSDGARLRARYGDRPGVDFLGRVPDDELAGIYARSRALVVPNTEEFGITAVEAQAAGRPVLAADAGGARETVVPGETGLFFSPGDVRHLAKQMLDPALARMSSDRAVENASRFSRTTFLEQFARTVEDVRA